MKERLSIFLRSRGFFLAHGMSVKTGMNVTCRSDLENQPLVTDGALLEKEALVKALRKMKRFEAECVVVLSDHEVISRIVPLPSDLTQKQIASGLRYSLRGKLPGNPEEYSINYYVPPVGQKKIFVTAIPKQMTKTIQEVFDELRLVMKAIIPITTALSHSLPYRPKEPVAFLEYKGDELVLGIGYNGFLTFSAVFPSNFTLSAGMQGFQAALRQWSLQLSRHFKAFESQLLLPVSALFLVGSWESLAPIEEIKTQLSTLLGVKVLFPAMPAGYFWDREVERSKEKGNFLLAVAGLSFFDRFDAPYIDLNRDFIEHPPPKPLPFPIQKALVAAGALLLLIFGFFSSKAFFSRRAERLVSLQGPVVSSPRLRMGIENPQKGKETPKPVIQAPVSEAIASLKALSQNGISIENITLEKGLLKVTGSCQEEGSIHSGLEELSKSPNIQVITLDQINREKEKLRFTLLVEFKPKS